MCFVGDPVAIVVAESRYLAEDAVELIDVEYEELPAVVGREFALSTELRTHRGFETNLAWAKSTPVDPELEQAFARSAHVITHTVHQHRHLNVPMEPRGIVADWERGEEQLTVHISSQNPHMDREYFARVLGLGDHRVRVTMRDVGGGFGQKIFRGREETAAVLASRRLGQPVKWIEDRQENLTAANHARDEQMTIKIGVDEQGVIQAMYADYLGDIGAYPFMPGSIPGGDGGRGPPRPVPPRALRVVRLPVFTNTSGLSAYRGPWLLETVSREIVIDVVARELEIDPAELRRRNILARTRCHIRPQPGGSTTG